jgi:dTDP-4-amino-4,6-dideoxygalactose transaminase
MSIQNITWLNVKNINYPNIENILLESKLSNHYSNDGPVTKKMILKLKYLLSINNDKEILLTNSGTSALHALVSAYNLKENRRLKFATQAFTFPSSAQGPLDNSQIVDITYDTGYGPDISQIDGDVDGLIVTNVFGYSVNIDHYVNWAKTNNKLLLFDNAATSYTFYKGQNVINYGNASIISFHHTKPIGFGEGGAIIVDKNMAEYVWRACNYGKIPNIIDFNWNKYCSNYKISDISAAFIYEWLNNFNDIVSAHKALYIYFCNSIIEKYGSLITLMPTYSHNTPFVSSLIMILPTIELTNKNINNYISNNIQCKRYYKPLINLPIASDLYDRIICFPCHKDMGFNHVDMIINLLDL